MSARSNRVAWKSLLPGLLATVLLAGCDTAPVRAVSDTYQDLVYKTRSKGEREIAGSEQVRRELGCSERRPFELRLEFSELLPNRLKSGREINNRFIYSACMQRDGAVTVTLVRRILFGGRVLFEDRDPRFVVRPGRWMIDGFIGIPPGASPGGYSVEVVLEPRGGPARRSSQSFEVLP